MILRVLFHTALICLTGGLWGLFLVVKFLLKNS